MARHRFLMCTQLSPIFYNLFVLLLILLPQLRSQQRDRVGEQHLILFCFVADTKRWDRLAICFFTCLCWSLLTLFLLVSINHPPFQATINMSGGSGAEDCSAGWPPRDESNACDESAEGANFASAEVRHRLTLLLLFCLSFCFLIAICSCYVFSLPPNHYSRKKNVFIDAVET